MKRAELLVLPALAAIVVIASRAVLRLELTALEELRALRAELRRLVSKDVW